VRKATHGKDMVLVQATRQLTAPRQFYLRTWNSSEWGKMWGYEAIKAPKSLYLLDILAETKSALHMNLSSVLLSKLSIFFYINQ